MTKKMEISLRKLKPKDAEGMLEWMHDDSCNRWFRKNTAEMSISDALQYIENSVANCDVDRHFAIVDEDDNYLGTISLKNINYVDKNAEYAIAMRGVAQGTGAARTATEMLIQMAFFEMGLEKIYLNVLSINERAVRFYEKCGFTFEGLSRKHACINGKLCDLKWYGLLKEDYNN